MERVSFVEVRDVPVGELLPHPQNANRGNVAEIARKLRTMGQYRTIVVNAETNEILAGNSTFKAARDQLGWTHVRAEFVRCTPARALEILAWDNRARDRSLGNDHEALLELLESIEQMGDLDEAGYAADDLDELRELLEAAEPEEDDLQVPDPGEALREVRAAPDRLPDLVIDPLRLIMIPLPQQQHEWATDMMGGLAAQWGVSDYPAVLLRLLAEATDETPPDVERPEGASLAVRIVAHVSEHPGLTRAAVAKAMGQDRDVAKPVIADLVKAGHLVSDAGKLSVP